jgi:hypothetical protein
MSKYYLLVYDCSVERVVECRSCEADADDEALDKFIESTSDGDNFQIICGIIAKRVSGYSPEIVQERIKHNKEKGKSDVLETVENERD